MFNLTQKAAKHFKVQFQSLESRSGSFWRLDIVYVERKKILMCVHEPTLYTHLLTAKYFKTLESTFKYLKEQHPWCRAELSIGKGQSRRVTGSITDMKITIKYMATYRPNTDLEDEINQTPYSYLQYQTPNMVIENHFLN